MKEKYYLDANIWIDYGENRKDRFRPLGEWALVLLNKIISENGVILVSDFLLDELRKQFNEKSLINLFQPFLKNIEKMKVTPTQLKKAAEIRKSKNLPFGDALHYVIAEENKAILVTRDKHFQELSGIAIKKPEELI